MIMSAIETSFNPVGMPLTLHTRLYNVQRMNYERCDGPGAQAGDSLDEGRGSGRMAVLGHKDRVAKGTTSP